MTIDVYTATGTKKGTATLPKNLFEAPINEGLMHQFLVLQQSNRRNAIAHSKTRSEVAGSTRKIYQQKGTGRARHGSIRSAIMRGGNKAFGPSSIANFTKHMPQTMRHAALRSCLSLQAKNGKIIGLEGYPETIKTKDLHALLQKLPVELGRRILLVVPEKHNALALSVRNIPRVKSVLASYLNPEDVLVSNHIVFLVDAIKKTEEVFGAKKKEKTAKNTTLVKKSNGAKKTSATAKAKKVSKTSTPKSST